MSQNFASVFPLPLGGATIPGYAALWALIANAGVAIVATLVLNALGVASGRDETRDEDYTATTGPEQPPVLDESPKAA